MRKTAHELPLEGQVLRRIEHWDDYGENEEVRPVAASIEDATIITSAIEGREMRHKILLDLDIPAKLIDSSTPGHHHLYIDHEMAWEDYLELLVALAKAGLVETGYVGASRERGFTALRLPWIKKGEEVVSKKGFEPRCARCHRTPGEIPEYIMMAKEENILDWEGKPDPVGFVYREEGTYNTANGRFWCTECYIALGQPLGKPRGGERE